MDYDSIFSALSLVAVFAYMYIGIYTYKKNRKSTINRFFLLLCTSYAIWSFAYAFAYLSYNKEVFSFWNKVSAIGWCSFSAITLYLVLLMTDNIFAKNNIVRILIFSPAALFFYMSVFLFGKGIKTPTMITHIFYIGDFLYNFSFLLMSILLIFLWGARTNSKRIKLQAKILIISSIIPFTLNLLTQTILPMAGYNDFPLMGQLYALIMIMGTYRVIGKYKFLMIPEKVVLEEVENKIIDMVIVVNEKGELIKVSSHTLSMLGYEENELINKKITILFDYATKEKFTLPLLQQDINYYDIEIVKKKGTRIPVNVHAIPIWDKKINDFLGAAIVMQDISIEYELRKKNEELHQKSIRDGLTNLYNHQYSFELLDREINEAGYLKRLSLLMIDIDYFKKVNDTYGHLFGDCVLKTIAGILMTTVDDNGYVGRFGGEEFIIILPDTDLNKAYETGEKIRSSIEHYEFDQNLKLTVSIGVSQYKTEYTRDFVKKTDDLLYKAKQNGRNRVEG
ncbi:diguanylate cyclase [Aminipila terrae]|uniref:Diguanylate cyclase n=1 Tax=Aminipila terrae TaxID=2697030 RepID=A0A6P1MMF0_9FIRM|nr:diguanylate cyclase [Aminipila terrae]QHI73844.1 diguanylate cyclase [Aminipila terrae]